MQCLWAAYFLLVSVIHLLKLDFMLIICAVSATLCLILQAVLLIKPALIRYVSYGSVQLLAFSAITLLPTGHSALLPVALIIFTIYALVPMKIICSAIVCASLTVLQLVALVFLTSAPFSITQVIRIYCF